MEKKHKLRINDRIIELHSGQTLNDAAKIVQSDYDSPILLAHYDGRLVELFTKVTVSSDVVFFTVKDKNGRRAYRRSLVFLMQKAIDLMYEDQKMDVQVLFSVGTGYYCTPPADQNGSKVNVSNDFLTQLKSTMQELVSKDIPIGKAVFKTRDAINLFHNEGLFHKERLLRYRSSSNINLYELDGLYDYFYGYMVPSTGVLKEFDLLPYDEGFILQFIKKGNDKLTAYQEFPKLFTELKKASDWGDKMDISTVGALNDAIAAGRTRELILLQEAIMEARIGKLANAILKEPGRKFIMIAGPSSSGKTTFSHRLSTQLLARGVYTHPIPLDMYYKNRDQMPLDEFGEKDFEALEGLDIERFNDDMNSLLEGRTTELPIFNFTTGKREARGRELSIGADDLLVIEGIHGLNDALSYSLPRESKFKIYISALTQLAIDEHNPLSTTDGRLFRRIVRDARTRGTKAEGTIAMWDSVRRGEDRNIFPFQEEADVLFNSALIYEHAVLKTYAQPLLFGIPEDSPVYPEAKRLKKLLTYFLPMPADYIAKNSLIREFIGGSCYQV